MTTGSNLSLAEANSADESSKEGGRKQKQSTSDRHHDFNNSAEYESQIQNLNNDESSSLSLFIEARGKKRLGAIILVHDIGEHQDWNGAVHILRNQLPNHGWASLSIPNLLDSLSPVENTKKSSEPSSQQDDQDSPTKQAKPNTQNFKSAISFLQNKAYGNIVLVCEGFAANQCLGFLQKNRSGAVKAIIAINSKTLLPSTNPEGMSYLLKDNPLPFLEILPELSFDKKLAKLNIRAAQKNGRASFEQTIVPGAFHDFNKQEGYLIKKVRGWLRAL